MQDDIDFVEDDIILDEEETETSKPKKPVTVPMVQEVSPTDIISQVPESKDMYSEIEKEENELNRISIDMTRLNDPSYLPVIQSFMNLRKRKVNMMEMEEFNQYRPIFEPNSSISQQEKQDLFVKWQFRISVREPVEVYDHGILAFTLPPLFATTNTISSIGHEAASNIVNGFYSANSLEMDINNRQGYWGNQLINAFRYAQSQSDLKKQEEKAEEQARKIIHQPEAEAPDKVSNNETVPSDAKEPEVEDEIVEDYL